VLGVVGCVGCVWGGVALISCLFVPFLLRIVRVNYSHLNHTDIYNYETL